MLDMGFEDGAIADASLFHTSIHGAKKEYLKASTKAGAYRMERRRELVG